MTEFKIGDRVKVYGDVTKTNSTRSHFVFNGYNGEVISLHPSGWITVFLSDEHFLVHPKQCRRLKPKQRREWWLVVGGGPNALSYDTEEEARRRVGLDTSGFTLKVVHVREVKKK